MIEVVSPEEYRRLDIALHNILRREPNWKPIEGAGKQQIYDKLEALRREEPK